MRGSMARRMRRGLTTVVLLVTGIVGLSTPAQAASSTPAPASVPLAAAVVPGGVQDFTFESMDVDYTLGRTEDGTSTLRVVETFVALFPEFDQNRGMQRALPEFYNGAPLHPDVVSVTDGEGNPRSVETESEDGFLYVTSRADGYVHGAQTYVFTYTMQNVTWTFADTDADEFYWDVNGTEWAQPFGRVSATVHMDAALADALTGRQACYRGAMGDTDTCEIRVEKTDAGATATAEAAGLGPYQTMTIAIGFARGTFTPFDPSYLASPFGWLQGIAGLGALAALVGGLVARRRLRDEPGRGTIIPEYAPPAGVDALLGAVLLGQSTKAIPAEILEQAVAGSIRIVETGRTWSGKVKLQALLIDPSRADGDGIMLIEGLFGANPVRGAAFEFGRSDSRFASAAQKIQSWANAELLARGLRRRVNPGLRALPILLGALATVLIFVFGIVAIENGVSKLVPILTIIAAVPVLLVTILLVSRRPLTAAGSRTKEHLLGLKMFIEWAEADRIRMLQSPTGAERFPVDVNDPRQVLRLYEILLPYAVVFGQEREWAERLAVLYGDQTPYWYYGTAGFSASAFSSGIGSLSASAASASSSSGGSGGGGSAGGGGGGGGGGGV